MNEIDPFEAELQKLRPARAPEDLLGRLASCKKIRDAENGVPTGGAWRLWLRWLAPATALVLGFVVLVLHSLDSQEPRQQKTLIQSSKPSLQSENVEFDQQLVAAFDAVARLPGGEPVRFRCREWRDLVTVRDPARGLVIEQQTPRLEITPVSYDIY